MNDNAAVAAMIGGVGAMIRKAVARSGLPPSEWEDVEADVRLALVPIARGFAQDGRAKWSTFAHPVIENIVKRSREAYHRITKHGREATGETHGNLFADPHDGPADLAADAEDGPTPETEDAGETFARLFRGVTHAPLLDTLSPGYRKIVELIVLDGLSVDQAAVHLGHPAKLVRMNLGAAVGQLAKAGHVPAAVAAGVGLDAGQLAERNSRAGQERRAAERRPRVLELAGRGLTHDQIAVEVGASPAAVGRDLAREGLPARTKAALSAETRAEVLGLLAAGRSVSEVAAGTGLPVTTVKGLHRREKPGVTPPDLTRDEVRLLLLAGHSRATAAARLGLSVHQVTGYLRGWADRPAAVKADPNGSIRERLRAGESAAGIAADTGRPLRSVRAVRAAMTRVMPTPAEAPKPAATDRSGRPVSAPAVVAPVEPPAVIRVAPAAVPYQPKPLPTRARVHLCYSKGLSERAAAKRTGVRLAEVKSLYHQFRAETRTEKATRPPTAPTELDGPTVAGVYTTFGRRRLCEPAVAG